MVRPALPSNRNLCSFPSSITFIEEPYFIAVFHILQRNLELFDNVEGIIASVFPRLIFWIHGFHALPEGSYPLHSHVGAVQDIEEHGNAWLALERSPNSNSLASFVYATPINFAMVALEVTDDFWVTVTQWVNLLGLVPKDAIRIRAFQLVVSIDCSVQSRGLRLRDEGSIMLVIN